MILPDLTNSCSGVLHLAHCHRVGVFIGVGIDKGVCVSVDFGVGVGTALAARILLTRGVERKARGKAHLCLLGLLEIMIPT